VRPSSPSGIIERCSSKSIHLGADEGSELRPVDSVRALAGKGLRGDRHFRELGAKPGQALTLVEAENVEAVGLPPGATRRQVTTRGVRLNEPCAHLQSMTRPGIIKELVHRAGINADVLTDGTISVGDEVVAD
jgi:MOSC domain-containing protein YiiM